VLGGKPSRGLERTVSQDQGKWGEEKNGESLKKLSEVFRVLNSDRWSS